ncbi:DUF3168 domain-containing protein [Sphingobium sp. CR2-8]|uniref:DUF3168 domain-containing protein n=1 Tax=Sphingobium sp. CR2-8 TaxID=1306534 RepID=UPI002DB61FAB|nr:DUF3168 domain-containing protein [Sphingobium sp. CR2-8]MEC3911634.1 DUF3168 domain-containing protein [Sphingobium sp. CR2-8]
MSAEVAARAAVIAALRADAVLMAGLNGLFDGEPGRASAPYGHVGEAIGADWGGKDVAGREVRLTIGLRSPDKTPGRLGAMIARIDPALASAPMQDGWRIVTARLIRSRVAREDGRAPMGWRAVIDYRLRVVWEG